MFVDRVRVWARGGKGGSGCSSFRREAFVPRGGPDGGDGGDGGHVLLTVNPHLNNLTHLRYKPHHFAEKGAHGKGAQRTGRKGKPLTIEVPPGTVISRLPAPQDAIERSVPFESGEVVADLKQAGETFILAQGGKGGRGNLHFKSPTNKAPTECEVGGEGEYGQFAFELKSIADVGLVGFPNAGKSSLLRCVSAATPKVAPYPFTTMTPQIGVIDSSDGKKRFTMADIPGLIDGASQGVGLGHDFLRHIERCSLLVFVIDMSGLEQRDPIQDFIQLRKEIKNYNADLAKRDYLVVGNKLDLKESLEHLDRFRSMQRIPVLKISAETREGIDALIEELFCHLEKNQAAATAVEAARRTAGEITS
ncbi:MAG: GTPase ObgE [Verrucomicrobiota bacterium]